MKRPILAIFSFASLCCVLLLPGCASSEAPPTAEHEAKSNKNHAEEEAKAARKFARWTTPQLIRERDELVRQVSDQGGPFFRGNAIVAIVEQDQRQRLYELNLEISRRDALAQTAGH